MTLKILKQVRTQEGVNIKDNIENEKILDFARDLFNDGEITKDQLEDTYFSKFSNFKDIN